MYLKKFENVKLFCFPDNAELIPNTDVLISPTTFNDELIVVALLSVVFPETFKVDTNVEGLLKLINVGGFNIELQFKLVNAVPEPMILPTTFNDELIVVALLIVVFPETFNADNNVHVPETYKLLKFVLLFINKFELLDNEFKLLNIVVDVEFKLLIDNIELVDNEFKFVLVAYSYPLC